MRYAVIRDFGKRDICQLAAIALLSMSFALQAAAAVPGRKKATAPPVRVACVGNSITYGTGIQDRARDVIRSGGEWIYSAQLENLIVATEEVVECAVIGFPDDKWVERPLAVTMLYPGIERTRETAERLRDQLRDRLPNWMLPEYWTFVDEVDKTSVGKYDKKDLRNHLRNGDFEVIKLKGPGEK